MGIEMKIIFLQNLTGGLFGGILKGLLKNRLNGLFARTPTVAVLLLTAVIAACASSSDSNSSGPTTTTTTTTVTADCTFDEDVGGTIDCAKLLTLPQFNTTTTYNITIGEIGKEGATDKLGLGNFTFTEIVNRNPSDPNSGSVFRSVNPLTLSINSTALNITISGIDKDLFGNFYIDLDLILVDDVAAEVAVKFRYTISITSVNDAPVFVRGNSPGVQFDSANDARNASYGFAGIPFNSTAGYSVGNVSVTDIDNDTITYRIIGGADDIALFQINPTTGESAKGEITLKAIADADSVGDYTFNVTASDRNGGSATAVITVSVLSDNQPPVFRAVRGLESQFTDVDGTTPANYNFAGIPINSPVGYPVGNVLADGAVLYEVIGEGSDAAEDEALFEINSEGEIILKVLVDTPYEYTFNVNATDDQDEQTTATISVYVDNTAPMLEGVTPYEFSLSLSDARARGVVVGNVSATDEQRTLFDYSLVNNGDLFERAPDKNIDGSINITLSRAATLSDFAAPSITFQVVARHQGDGMSTNADVTVNLINNLPFDDDFDGDGVQGFYDAFPHDDTMNVMGDGEPGNPFIISNIYQLQAIAGVDHAGTALDSSTFTIIGFLYGTNTTDQLTKHYMLANDINASATNTDVWNKPEVEGYIGQGWTPIAGKSGQSFSGSFSGEGYAINSLEILARQGDNSKHFGLFGINNGNITAVGLQNINMVIQAEGNNYLGTTTVDTIVDGSHAGGLVALNQEDGNITYSYTTGLANGSMDAMGGLVGLNQGKISYSYSTATVQGAGDTGGLLGTNQGGALLSSYATGSVRGSHGIEGRDGTAGGLAGSISGAGAIINTSYAAGSVSNQGGDEGASLGGVIGERNQTIGNGVTIESSYWNSAATTGLPGVGKDRNGTLDGDTTGTTGLTIAQLQGCELGGTESGDCMSLFPSANWADDTTDGITRSWIFNDGEYPSLSAVRSPDEQLLPSAAEQECHRNEMPLGCEE